MVLGLRAMVAAGAQSVMVLHTSRQLVFEPEWDDNGKLSNDVAFQDYLTTVQQQGRPNQQRILHCCPCLCCCAVICAHAWVCFRLSHSTPLCAFVGIHLNNLAILTAHQMGSARMGVSRQVSTVDPDGESWDVQSLYVADASLMPTSTGAP